MLGSSFARSFHFHMAVALSVEMTHARFCRLDIYHDHSNLFRLCTHIKSLLQVHAHFITSGLGSDDRNCTHLVNSYSSFHRTDYARMVFDSTTKPSTILWNSMIRTYTSSGHHGEALKLYDVMLERGGEPDKFTFTFVIKACTGASRVEKGTFIHQEVARMGLDEDIYISAGIIDMYCKIGRIEAAQELFERMPQLDVVTWNIMIAGFSQSGGPVKALDLFRKMLGGGLQPNSVTLLNLFPAVASLSALLLCRSVHGFVVRRAFSCAVSNGLIDTYAKCGSVEHSRSIFDRMHSRDEVTWGSMMSGYAHNGYYVQTLELFDDAKRNKLQLNPVSAVGALLAAAETRNLMKGMDIHSYMLQEGINMDITVTTTLMAMYAKCGDIDKALQTFCSIQEKDVVAWSAMIAALVQTGHPEKAILFFQEMQSMKTKPNRVTIVSLLPACAELSDLNSGKSIHSYAIKADMGLDVSIGTALVAMYARCELFSYAHKLFDRLQYKDIVTWNALINTYAQIADAEKAMKMFHQLRSTGIHPDSGTMVGVLPACTLLEAFEQGTCFHGQIVKYGFESDLHVRNALVDMYAKCGYFHYAETLFNDTSFPKDEVSWNIMIAGLTKNGQAKDALSYFRRMRLEDHEPNLVTLVSILPAASYLAALKEGMCLHSYMIRCGYINSLLIGNSLIDMYAKCGRLDLSLKYFDQMDSNDIVSWNVMLSGYAIHGKAKDALSLFSHMRECRVKADSVSFLSVLSACRHGGLIKEGMELFEAMRKEDCLHPNVEHYACIVDLLGRAGRLQEAWDFIKKMPILPDAGVWGALLGACRMHSNVKLGEVALDHLRRLGPQDPAHYVVLSNIYAQCGRWADVSKMRLMMNDSQLSKAPGCSWVEIKGDVHAFKVGDGSHPQFESICMVWKDLVVKMEKLGYVPDTSCVLQNVEEEEKASLLHGHSERLAIAFALMNTEAGASIQIVKNLRVCDDCHAVTKLISSITHRKIIVRDASRFHHFENGSCSCNDYW